jgi:hypothetical protein
MTTRDRVVAAVRWHSRGFTVGPPAWLLEGVTRPGTPDKVVGTAMRSFNEVHIGTRWGVMVAAPGDWIALMSSGEIITMTSFEFALNGYDADRMPSEPPPVAMPTTVEALSLSQCEPESGVRE